jgi:flagellar hook-length control protein FliK
MSKITSTSGNEALVIKGSSPEGDATGDAAGLFASLFGGMQIPEIEGEADTAQLQTQQINTANSEQIIDPNLAAMLGVTNLGVPVQGKAATALDATDDTKTDGLDLDSDKVPDAGLLAPDSQLPINDRYRVGQTQLQSQSQMAALAEDLKKVSEKASAVQTQQPAELDEDFIGPPLPRAMQKLGLIEPKRADNNHKKVLTAARQTVHLQTNLTQGPVLKPKVLDGAMSGKATDEMLVTEVLDAASLKAERLPELVGRLADRPARIPATSVQLTSSFADAQTGLSAASHLTNSAQTSGQQSGSAFAGAAQTDLAEQWLDVLDMQDEKWTDQLVRRIDREFRTGGKGLELELNPRNLGRLKVSLSLTQDQTNVILRTETGAATQMLTEAEGRLVQMLGDIGLKLGQFNAYTGGQNRGFGQQGRQQEQNGTMSDAENDSQTGDTDTSDGLINLRA